MSLDPAKASRFGGSKVRTGCLTCVKRHLKCDEDYRSSLDGQHQTCRRCAKAGRQCQQRHQGAATSTQLRMVHYGSIVGRSPQSWPAEDNLEMRSIEYFKLRTAPELAGVHNPEIWSHLVMQAAVAEPAIWAATVALGALHERFETNASLTEGSTALQYPLAQYGRSLKLLCESIRTGNATSQDTPILACALFSAFESMGCHFHSALSHVTSGLKVIGEAKTKEHWDGSYVIRTHNSRTSLRLLFPLFTRLDTQRLELGDASFPSDEPLTVRRWKNMFAPLNDFHEARYQFDNILNDLLHQIKHIENHDMYIASVRDAAVENEDSTLSYSINAFLHWAKSFDKLLATTNSADDLPSCLLLQAWRLLVNIMLRYDFEQGEIGFDHFHYDFELMASLAAEFVCWSTKHNGPPELLFLEPIPNPLNEPLPHTLRQRHTAFAGQTEYRSGFMGVRYQSYHTAAIQEEAASAAETTRHLLRNSVTSRANEANWLSFSDSGQPSIKPRFTFSHGIIYPLYVVISRCREPVIRRKAWNIMYRCRRREGLWDANLAARLGQRIIQIEESQALQSMGYSDAEDTSSPGVKIHSSAQIPNWVRIRMLRPTFLPNRRSIERYYFGWPGSFQEATGIEEVWVEEIMSW